MKKYLLFFIFFFILYTTANAKKVYEICDCYFPAEIGAFKYYDVISDRVVPFSHIPFTPVIVRELKIERKEELYRVLILTRSSPVSSIGIMGAIIEIANSNGDIIYQLSPLQIYKEYLKLGE